MAFRLRTFAACLFAAMILTCAPAAAKSEYDPEWWLPNEATAGMQLTVREKERIQVEDPDAPYDELVNAEFSASGYPNDKIYELWSFSLDRYATKLATLRVDRSGNLRAFDIATGNLRGELSEINLTFGGYTKGEPFNFALVSIDKTVKAFAKIVLDPLEASDEGCRIWMELGSTDASFFTVWGDGFKPGEEVETSSRLGEEVIAGIQEISADGSFGPYVIVTGTMLSTQDANFSAIGRSCIINLDFVWGPSGFE